MEAGSLTSSIGASECDSIESLRQAQNGDGITDFLQNNDRLCSALLWSAKIAANSQQKAAYSAGKNRKLNWKNPALYKTRLCDYWSTGNPCKFGLNCWYAHGPVELRHVPRLDKDPVATSISLAEVVQRLPPSRDRSIALEQAENQLIANIKSDAFAKHTVQEITVPNAEPPKPKSPMLFHTESPEISFSLPRTTSRLPFFEQITAKSQEFQPRKENDDLDTAFNAYQPYLAGLIGSGFNNSNSLASPMPVPISLFEDPRWRF
ncbi:unnamed protein product [Bursaphelenchus okinawaensis]|uniref:C3H1-type domain-containing protein n=1 Tax=Bursaphelenchus okinawaensis TaxID=465554 RepID=A0A811KN79_9BILA|nr:unnamed protein product [Bursaphelenchus okinawaensis]CAG9106631.1 unnamed protein product [Bursaphelenchus okinawaensis]